MRELFCYANKKLPALLCNVTKATQIIYHLLLVELENSSILLLVTVLLGNLKDVSIKVHQSFFIQACSSGIILINIIFRRQMKTICVFKLENHYHSSPSQCRKLNYNLISVSLTGKQIHTICAFHRIILTWTALKPSNYEISQYFLTTWCFLMDPPK